MDQVIKTEGNKITPEKQNGLQEAINLQPKTKPEKNGDTSKKKSSFLWDNYGTN